MWIPRTIRAAQVLRTFCVALVLHATAFGAPPEENLGEVLAKVREAVGAARWAEHKDGIRLDGTTHIDQHPGQPAAVPTSLFQRPDGRFHRFMGIGEDHESLACDGRKFWRKERDGSCLAIGLQDRTEAILEVGVMTGRLFDEKTPLTFQIDAAGTTDETVRLTFEMHKGRTVGHVDISRTDWRPVEWTAMIGEKLREWELVGEIAFGGVRFPRMIVSVQGAGGAGGAWMVRFAKAEAAEASESRYQFRPAPPADMTFDPAIPAEVDAKMSVNRHLLVRARLNGGEARWFMLDSGCGGNVLSEATAHALGAGQGARAVVDGTVGAVQGGRCTLESLSIGSMTIRKPEFQTQNLETVLAAMGEPEGVAGILGYDVFARCVLTIDHEAPLVRLYPPGAEPGKGLGKPATIVFSRLVPFIATNFEAHTGVFMLDTGSNGTVNFTAPTVERLRLLEGRETTPSRISGVGGGATARQGTLRSFGLGEKMAANFPAQFMTERQGVFADTYMDGIVGLGLLRGFVMVFDYPRSRVTLVPLGEWKLEAE